jgi:heterodisulfide reductase subunit C
MCFKCLRCPRDVKPVEVFSNLRKIAIAKGVDNIGSKLVKAFVEVVGEYGRLVETKFMMKFMGLDSLKMLPPSVAFKMWKAGKVSLSAKKAECAEEVKKIFEVCGHA